MANVKTSGDSRIFKIEAFLGLNENPDGDTHIENGELSDMWNFRITADRHLQLRPGQKTILMLRDAWNNLAVKPEGVTEPRACGLWSGLVDGQERLVAAYGGVLWDLSTTLRSSPRQLGTCTQDDTTFFGFSNRVYMLNGHEYLCWDGGPETSFVRVEGYIPTVVTASNPEGTGIGLENVNRLTGLRKVKYSPDGKAVNFRLPETDVDEVVAVIGTEITYSLDKTKGVLTFQYAPDAGVNTLSVTYRKGEGSRNEVERMRFCELFNGATDSRVFLYGDGTNRCIFSGNDLDKGMPSAEYFPDLSEVAVGEANSPLTGLIRHYDRMLAYKRDSTWAITSAVVTAPGGGAVATFPVQAVNRSIGNEAPGQVKLLENNPLSLADGGVYQWKPGNNAAGDHRQADRISKRVATTLSKYRVSEIKTFNDKRHMEFWFLWGGEALILNYHNNTWYRYTNVPYIAMADVADEIYGFTADGRLVCISREYRNDDGAVISAHAETGSMDFGRDWMLKFSPVLFVSIQPESGGRVQVSVETNRRSDYQPKMVVASLSTFAHVDFNHFSFGTNRKPQVRRVRMKVKKATYYKLIFESNSASATGTVLGADIQVRFAGKVK